MSAINGHTILDMGTRVAQRAVIKVSYELLEELLHFPVGRIVKTRDGGLNTVELTVECSEFSIVETGKPLPVRTLSYTSDQNGEVTESKWV